MMTQEFVALLVTAALLLLSSGMQAAVSRPMPSSDLASKPAAGRPTSQLAAPVEAEFKSTLDGSTQKYMILLPKEFDAATAHDVMIAFHGHGSDRRQYATDRRDECAAARDVAARYSMIFISPDYRAPASWMGPAAEADTVQLIAELKKKFKVGKVLLTGASMGGTAVLTFAALHKDLADGVCSLNGTANLVEYNVKTAGIADAIKDSFGSTAASSPSGGREDQTADDAKARLAAEYRKRSAEFHAEQFTMPLAIVVSGKDKLVPPQSALRLGLAVQKHNRHVLVVNRSEAGHATNYADAVAALEFVVAAMAGPTAAK